MSEYPYRRVMKDRKKLYPGHSQISSLFVSFPTVVEGMRGDKASTIPLSGNSFPPHMIPVPERGYLPGG